MTKKLSWNVNKQTVLLNGELNRDTLILLWQKKHLVLNGIKFLNFSNIHYVDSAGLALMLYLFYYQKKRGVILTFTGVNYRLRMLIALYKLQNILNCNINVDV